jgi:hypothetical protein
MGISATVLLDRLDKGNAELFDAGNRPVTWFPLLTAARRGAEFVVFPRVADGACGCLGTGRKSPSDGGHRSHGNREWDVSSFGAPARGRRCHTRLLGGTFRRGCKVTLILLFITVSVAAAPRELAIAGRYQADSAPSSSAGSDFLAPDYLPLNLGNRWIYTHTESRFKKTDAVRVEIISTPIIKWKTYYIFSQLPFVPGLESANNVPVRYDVETRRFLRLTERGEVPLLPVGPDSDARFDPSVDENGKPVQNRQSYLTCPDCSDSGMEIVFDRGTGVTAVQVTHSWGTENYDLKSAEVNQKKFGEPILADKPKDPVSRPAGPVISRADPNLSLTLEKKDTGALFIFKVKNPTESFLSLNFTSSQDFDFVVREKESGFEIWRWSKGNFFSPVVRNVALLPEQEKKHEVFWDFKDNEGNDIQKGEYLVSAILTTRDPRESAPVSLTLP